MLVSFIWTDLWKIWGQPENHAVLKGHTNAVLEVQYTSNGSVLLSASADQTLATWDLESLTRVRRFREHAGVVNSVCPSRRGRHIFASGSDDGTCRVSNPLSLSTTISYLGFPLMMTTIILFWINHPNTPCGYSYTSEQRNQHAFVVAASSVTVLLFVDSSVCFSIIPVSIGSDMGYPLQEKY